MPTVTPTDTRPGTPDERTALMASVTLTGPELDAFIAETNAESERILAQVLAHDEAARLDELARSLLGESLPDEWLFADEDTELTHEDGEDTGAPPWYDVFED